MEELPQRYVLVRCPSSELIIQHTSERAEEADDDEIISCDEGGYPQLPDDLFQLPLHKRKAWLRMYMQAARGTYLLMLFFSVAILT